jgi:hypothetical protein
MYVYTHEHDELASLPSQFRKHDISLFVCEINVTAYNLFEFLYVCLLLDCVCNSYAHIFRQKSDQTLHELWQ